MKTQFLKYKRFISFSCNYLESITMKRTESEQKKMNFMENRIQMAQSLLKLIHFDEPYNICNTLFGYFVGITNLPLIERITYDIKRQFTTLQQLYYSKVFSGDSIVAIVVDVLQNFKKYQKISQKQVYTQILNVFQYNIEETMTNERFIIDKWERQYSIIKENQQNQKALRQFLDEQKHKNKMKAQQIESQGWQCQVCYSEIERDQMGLLECGHIFHPQCINAYLKSKIQSNQTDISCPMEGCNKKLDVGDIYGFIDGDLKQKYQKFSFNKFVQMNNSCTAWCPTAGCPAVFEFDEHLDNYKCPACIRHYCLRCRCDYHYGMTCAQYKINNSFDKNDQDFIKFVQGAKYKQCPKCKYWVERRDGCSTMVCKCGQQFCYDCGGTTCPHGMCANLGIRPPVLPVAMPPAIGGRGGRGGRGGKRR